ncbi:MAG: hypothetical protein ACRDRS_05300 [Pseudonocardiaceae bacterium]
MPASAHGADRAPRPAGISRSTGGIPSLEEIWGWQNQLVDFGTKYTGSAGHSNYVDWLAERFAAIPGFTLKRDRLTFNRWLAREYSLSIITPTLDHPRPVPVTYYYPYSGKTPEGGVTGTLVDLGAYPPAAPDGSRAGYTPEFWAPARGAIALVRAPVSTYSLDAGQIVTGGYDSGKSSAQVVADYQAYATTLTNPAWQGIFNPIPLLDAKNAGVLAVVCVWTGMPDDEVINQYNPFTSPYPAPSGLATPDDAGCPALWVGERTGSELAAAATTGQASATLVLTADITVGAATETLWGWLKGSGSTDENLIVNTHTDGPNATEENGGLGLLALAQHYAGLPSRNRDLYFSLVTGHFQLPQFTRAIPDARPEWGVDAISVWMLDHPEIYQRAVVGVTVEHLGCTMWANDPATGNYAATGGYEWGITYTTQTSNAVNTVNAEQDAYLSALASVNHSGWPNFPAVTVLPGAATPLYLGEGAPLYAGGLGTVSLIPLPTYLLQAGDAQHPERLDLDKLDKNLMYGQILTFAHVIETLDNAPASAL